MPVRSASLCLKPLGGRIVGAVIAQEDRIQILEILASVRVRQHQSPAAQDSQSNSASRLVTTSSGEKLNPMRTEHCIISRLG